MTKTILLSASLAFLLIGCGDESQKLSPEITSHANYEKCKTIEDNFIKVDSSFKKDKSKEAFYKSCVDLKFIDSALEYCKADKQDFIKHIEKYKANLANKKEFLNTKKYKDMPTEFKEKLKAKLEQAENERLLLTWEEIVRELAVYQPFDSSYILK